MGCPTGTVMSRLHRGRRHLKTRLIEQARPRHRPRGGRADEACDASLAVTTRRDARASAARATPGCTRRSISQAIVKWGGAMTRCHDIRPYLEAFWDDELSTEKSLDVEQHLGELCVAAPSSFSSAAALKRTTKRSREAGRAALAPSSWRACRRCWPRSVSGRKRVSRTRDRSPGAWSRHWQQRPPWCSPSASMRERQQPRSHRRAGAASGGSVPTNLMDELVRYHAAPSTPEVTDRSRARRLRSAPRRAHARPASSADYGARFLGASLVPVEHRRAASLQYNVAGHRVTVYVFNPQWVPVRSLRSPRAARHRRPRRLRRRAPRLLHRRHRAARRRLRHRHGSRRPRERRDRSPPSPERGFAALVPTNYRVVTRRAPSRACEGRRPLRRARRRSAASAPRFP